MNGYKFFGNVQEPEEEKANYKRKHGHERSEMPKKLKLTRNELHRLQKELADAVLGEQGHSASEITAFHENVEKLGVQELYRPIILKEFLLERKEDLGGREVSVLFNSRDETSGELLPGKKDETLVVVPADLKSYLITTLILISKDSPETLLPARKGIFQAIRKDMEELRLQEETEPPEEGRRSPEDSEDEEGRRSPKDSEDEEGCWSPEDSEDEEGCWTPENSEGEGEEREPPAPDHWEQMGQQLTRENLNKCTRYPPMGFVVKKLGRGWLFTKSRDGNGEMMSLPKLFIQLAVPLLASRTENLHLEQDKLRKELRERKGENKRLLEKIQDLKEQLKAEKKGKLESHRTVRTLTKSNKQMKRRLNTSKDESDYEHMYG